MFSSLIDSIYLRVLKAKQTIIDRKRWCALQASRGEGVRVYYGVEKLPRKEESISGGIVKCQDLAVHYPNISENPNILYLVSSSLPINVFSLVNLAKSKGLKVVLNQNGVAYAAWHGRGWEKVNDHLRKVLFSADYVIYQSKFCRTTADYFLGQVDVPATLLYNPVDTKTFQVKKRQGSRTLLVAGTHHHGYRVELAIQALSIVRKKGLEAQLHVAGPLKWDRSEQAIKKQLTQWCVDYKVEGCVHFSGPYSQNRVQKLFAEADILIHSQYNDVCPRLLVESLACGVPPVFSLSGGSPEIVSKEAGVGIQVPSGFDREYYPAPNRIADAVFKVYDRYDCYSKAARNRAEVYFDTGLWIAKHKEIFNSLLR